MKIAFSTLSCPDWSWEKVIKEASRLGYDGIEVRGADGELYLPKAAPFIDDNLNRTIEDLQNSNLKITDLGSSVSFHNPDVYNNSLAEGKAYIDLAQKLGVPYVRIFGDSIPDPDRKDETLELISRGIRELCSYCEGKNVVCLLETHGDIVGLDTLVPIIEKVDSPYMGLIWDIAHTYRKYGNDITEFLNGLFKYIKHVHIKDLRKTDQGYDLCMIGDGDIDIAKIINALRERGYEGYLSLEWEKKWHPSLEEPEVVIPAYIEYMRKFL